MAAQGADAAYAGDEAHPGSDSDDELYGFAVAVRYEDARWSCTALEDSALESLADAVRQLRALRASGPVFALMDVDEAFFAVVRPGPEGPYLALSDATCALDYDLAADMVDALGVDVPDMTPAEIEDSDPWPEGNLAILEDLGLPEPVLNVIMDEVELYPDEQLAMIAERMGFADELAEFTGDDGDGSDAADADDDDDVE